MKKDDPMSCINTDTHSQQQQGDFFFFRFYIKKKIVNIFAIVRNCFVGIPACTVVVKICDIFS